MHSSDPDHILQQAFENSLQANIISIVGSGTIIRANRAACKLLGYSKKELLTRNRKEIFRIMEESYKTMIAERTREGSAKADLSIVRNNIIIARSKSDFCQAENNDWIKSIGKTTYDVTWDWGIATNLISFGKSYEKVFGYKLPASKVSSEAIVEAKEMERSDIGKELHDNVNQLLGASMLYLDMARKDITNGEIYLIHSSEYTFTAIEEIKKLAKGLMTDTIKDFGLCAAIEHIARDTMETHSVKIHCKLAPSLERGMSDKFKMNAFTGKWLQTGHYFSGCLKQREYRSLSHCQILPVRR